MLTSTDIEVLTSFHDHLNLSPEMVAVLLSHASTRSKKMRYAEAIANDWFDKGITTVEAAANYIEAINSGSDILRFFGIVNREPSKKEREFIVKWCTKLKFSKELIQEACERTLNSAGKASFPYADSILESWYNKGLTTLEQVKEENRLFNEQKSNKPKPVVKTEYKPVKPNYTNKFNDFAQRTYTEEEFREIIKKKGGI
jgi:DnaD/phage-associated family protein